MLGVYLLNHYFFHFLLSSSIKLIGNRCRFVCPFDCVLPLYFLSLLIDVLFYTFQLMNDTHVHQYDERKDKLFDLAGNTWEVAAHSFRWIVANNVIPIGPYVGNSLYQENEKKQWRKSRWNRMKNEKQRLRDSSMLLHDGIKGLFMAVLFPALLIQLSVRWR